MEEDEDIAQSTTLKSALNKLKHKKHLAKRQHLLDLRAKGIGSVQAEVRHGDARDLIKKLDDESVDHIVTNAPFGIDLTMRGEKPYEDDPEEITDLMIELCSEFHRVLKPTGWAVIFFDMKKITCSPHLTQWAFSNLKVKDKQLYRALGLTQWLLDAGFEYVTPTPGAWVKPNKTHGQIGDPSKGFISSWEAYIFAAKTSEARLLKQGRSNHLVYDVPTSSERIHEVQMPTDLCGDLLSMVALGGETVLDPFAGSGSFGVAAISRQVNFLGFELDKTKCDLANVRLQEAIQGPEDSRSDGDSGSEVE